MRPTVPRLVVPFLVAAGMVLLPAFGRAGVTLVDTRNDSLADGDTECSLREAIQAANGSFTSSDCGASPSIGFDTGALGPPPYVFQLTLGDVGPALPEDMGDTGDLDVHVPMTIDAAGFGLTAGDVIIEAVGSDANPASGRERVFHVHPGGDLTLLGVTVRKGHDGFGGGIYGEAASTISIDQSAVEDNGAATAGGGIRSEGILNIHRSAIIGNGSLGTGGGIESFAGTLNIANSTVAFNTAGTSGGGIHVTDGNRRGGVGIGEAHLSFVTIADNTAVSATGGAGLDIAGAATGRVRASYFFSNISEQGTPGSPGDDLGMDCNPAVFHDGDLNFVDFSCNGNPGFRAALPWSIGPLDPHGAGTRSYGLYPGQLAVDADLTITGGCTLFSASGFNPFWSDGAPNSVDQRGFPRPFDAQELAPMGSMCDAGAFELQGTEPVIFPGADPGCTMGGYTVELNPPTFTDSWTMLGIPCVQAINPSPFDMFSDDIVVGGALRGTATYGFDWAVWERDHFNDQYLQVGEFAGVLDHLRGYWFGTTLWPDTKKVTMDGQMPTPPFSILLEEYGAGPIPAGGIPNQLGSPAFYPVRWGPGTLVVSASGTCNLGCTLPTAVTQGILGNDDLYKDNGFGSYDTYDPTLDAGMLFRGQGGWVFVDDASTDGPIHLQINDPGFARAGVPIEGPRALTEDEWRMTVSVLSGSLGDFTNRFGRLQGSSDGRDPSDAPELAPPDPSHHLSLSFPRPEWDPAGNFSSDYRSAAGDGGTWRFEVSSSLESGTARLTWTGPSEITARSVLVDERTGLEVPLGEGPYSFELDGEPRGFLWTVVDASIFTDGFESGTTSSWSVP